MLVAAAEDHGLETSEPRRFRPREVVVAVEGSYDVDVAMGWSSIKLLTMRLIVTY